MKPQLYDLYCKILVQKYNCHSTKWDNYYYIISYGSKYGSYDGTWELHLTPEDAQLEYNNKYTFNW